jgi:hypothetical protein
VAEGYCQGDAKPAEGWDVFLKELGPAHPNPFPRSVVFARLFPYQEEISKALAANTASTVWQTLHDQSGISVSKASFYRYVNHFFPDIKKQCKTANEIESGRWMRQVLQNAYSYPNARKELGEIKELKILLQNASSGRLKVRNRAISILAHTRGISFSTIAEFLFISRKSACQYFKSYGIDSFSASFPRRSTRMLKANNEKNVNAVFSLLHGLLSCQLTKLHIFTPQKRTRMR